MMLRLLDGSLARTITHASTISIKFPCGTFLQTWFLLTKLDRDFPAVLGLDWVTLHNPLIDWVRHSVTFRNCTDSLLTPPSDPKPSLASVRGSMTSHPWCLLQMTPNCTKLLSLFLSPFLILFPSLTLHLQLLQIPAPLPTSASYPPLLSRKRCILRELSASQLSSGIPMKLLVAMWLLPLSLTVRGHLRAPTSLTEYVHLTTLDKLRLADTLYIPPHHRRPHHSSPTVSPSQPPLTNQAQSWT